MKYILKIIGFFSVSFYIISKIVYASDWVQLSETDSAIHYIQKKPEKTKSPIKEVWEMQDLKKLLHTESNLIGFWLNMIAIKDSGELKTTHHTQDGWQPVKFLISLIHQMSGNQ